MSVTGKLLLRHRSRQLLKRILGREPSAGEVHAGEGLVSYSQQGEDMILQCLFQGHGTGFYVDVGAHHPSRYSNTYFFYLRGWRGINIDAMPGSMAAFRAVRPEDINLEYAIAATKSKRTFHVFDDPALNGFSRELSESREAEGTFRLVGRQEISTLTLAEVLDTHLPRGQAIDFLNIDVEGLDLEVLRSNDWTKYRPKVVVTEETASILLDEVLRSEPIQFLRRHGYGACAKTAHTVFLADETRLVKSPSRFFS